MIPRERWRLCESFVCILWKLTRGQILSTHNWRNLWETLLSSRLKSWFTFDGSSVSEQSIPSGMYKCLRKIRSCCERPHPRPPFMMMLGQTHTNGWGRVIASQNGGSTSYIFPLRLGVLQWSHHLFNYWKNKKTIIEKFLSLLI